MKPEESAAVGTIEVCDSEETLAAMAKAIRLRRRELREAQERGYAQALLTGNVVLHLVVRRPDGIDRVEQMVSVGQFVDVFNGAGLSWFAGEGLHITSVKVLGSASAEMSDAIAAAMERKRSAYFAGGVYSRGTDQSETDKG